MVLLFWFAGFVLIANHASADSIKGSKHDFTPAGTSGFSGNFDAPDEFGMPAPVSEVCVFCHTPHNAASGAAAPLWNRSTPSRTYLMYSSSTMSATVPSGPQGVSALCMSCHDGVTSIAVGTLLNEPNGGPVTLFDSGYYDKIGQLYSGTGWPAVWKANIGNQTNPSGTIDMRNDHPISFIYPTNAAGIRNAPTDPRLRLFGTAPNKTVECSTCHLVHDNQYPPFLAMPNDGSNMCLACHDK